MPRALAPLKLPGNTVLRRCSQLLQQELVLEDAVLEMMREDGCLDPHITDNQWEELEGMGIATRTHYMLELLLSKNEDAIQRFVTVLGKHLDTAMFSDMLKYEMLNEKGELKPDAIKMEEAAMIVHRQFGTSKRLSQFEKKLLQRIIAQKTQIYDRMYKREVQRLLRRIEEEKLRAKQKDIYAKELTDKLKQFFNDNSAKIKRLTDLTGNISSDPESYGLTNKNPDNPGMLDLEAEVVGTLDLASKALMEMDIYKDEKTRAMQAMGRLRQPGDVPMDDQIQRALDQLARELITTKTSAMAHQEDLYDLAQSIDGYKVHSDNELTQREKLISQLQKELEVMSTKLSEWTETTAELREKVRARQEEVDDWRTRLELIDRGKRLKNIHRRDGYTLEGDLALEADEVLTDGQYRTQDSLGAMATSRGYNSTLNAQHNGYRQKNGGSVPSSSSSTSRGNMSSGALSRKSTQSLPPLNTRKNNSNARI